MPVPKEILVLGSTALAREVRRQLTPHSRYRVHHTLTVSIDTFLEHREPDLAIVELKSPDANAIKAIGELRRYQKKFPIIVIGDSDLPDASAMPNVTAVLLGRRISGQLHSLVSLLLHSFQSNQLLPTKGVPLGVITANAMPGSHISILLHDDNDLRQVTRFWKVADPEDALVFIGNRSAIRVYETNFSSEGLQFRMRREKKIAIVEADVLTTAVMEQVYGSVMSAIERGAKLVRIIGTLPGWTQKKSSQAETCEHLWNPILDRLPAILLCPYRVKVFDASSLVARALETHPLVISRNRLFRSSNI